MSIQKFYTLPFMYARNYSQFFSESPSSSCFYTRICILQNAQGKFLDIIDYDDNDYAINQTTTDKKESSFIENFAYEAAKSSRYADVTLQLVQRLFSGKSEIIRKVRKFG